MIPLYSSGATINAYTLTANNNNNEEIVRRKNKKKKEKET